MPIIRSLALGLLVLGLTMGAARADDNQQRVFNSSECAQKFQCTISSSEAVPLAGTCLRQNMGFSSDFSNSYLDSDNCLISQSASSDGKHSSTVKCCIKSVEGGDNLCGMSCLLLVN